MIKQLAFRNFKSFKEAKMYIAPLTVMIGANASGKSNALEGLRLLSWLAQGQKLHALRYELNRKDQVFRGFIKDIAWNNAGNFGFTVEDEMYNLDFNIESREDELHIVNESCYKDKKFLYRTKHPSVGDSIDMQVEYNNFARGGKKPLLTVSDQQPLFYQMSSVANLSINSQQAKTEILKASRTLENYLANILFLEPTPKKMRSYSNRGETNLDSTGSNLSGVLYHLLYQHQGAEENKNILLGLIRELPERDIGDIDFIETPRKEVMLTIKESFSSISRYVDAGLLSDGTLRILAVGVALLSARENSLVVIEEMDNGLHPSRASEVIKKLYNIATNRNISLLLTTHNPSLLNALPDVAAPHVVFCYRSVNDGSSKMVRLKDLDKYPLLLAQDRLGELLTKGLIERYAKDVKSDKERRRKFIEYIDNL